MITSNVKFEKKVFPGGEPHFRITQDLTLEAVAHVTFEYEKSEEIVDLLLLADALDNSGWRLGVLDMPYVPFSRQDRASDGEAFSLKVFAKILNGLFKHVVVTDPHSDVTTALFENVEVIEQHHVFANVLRGLSDFWLISPDGGALKKIYKLAAEVNANGVVECSKSRDLKTGAITGTHVHATDLKGLSCYIVDDICSGGATFTEIAKQLKKINCGPIHLMVSHGFFTRGMEVFDGLIDHIYTRKGKIK